MSDTPPILPKRRFGRTEADISVLTYGGGWVGGHILRVDQTMAEATLNRARAAGVDWFDTAALYGDGESERIMGEWLASMRSWRRPRLSTKFNVDPAGGDFERQIFSSVEASFKRLGVEHVPLIMLHNEIFSLRDASRPGRTIGAQDVLQRDGVADIMDKLRDQKICDWIGITGLGEPLAIRRVIDSGRFDVAQIYYNMLNPSAARSAGAGWNSTDYEGLLNACQAQDMGVMGIRIYAGGHLTDAARHGREIPVTANAGNSAEEARASAVFAALGEREEGRAETALRFGLASNLISTIVIGVGEAWHLERALEAVAQGPLSAAEIGRLPAIWAEHPAFRS